MNLLSLCWPVSKNAANTCAKRGTTQKFVASANIPAQADKTEADGFRVGHCSTGQCIADRRLHDDVDVALQIHLLAHAAAVHLSQNCVSISLLSPHVQLVQNPVVRAFECVAAIDIHHITTRQSINGHEMIQLLSSSVVGWSLVLHLHTVWRKQQLQHILTNQQLTPDQQANARYSSMQV